MESITGFFSGVDFDNHFKPSLLYLVGHLGLFFLSPAVSSTGQLTISTLPAAGVFLFVYWVAFLSPWTLAQIDAGRRPRPVLSVCIVSFTVWLFMFVAPPSGLSENTAGVIAKLASDGALPGVVAGFFGSNYDHIVEIIDGEREFSIRK